MPERRPALTTSVRSVTRAVRSGRRNGPPIEQRNCEQTQTRAVGFEPALSIALIDQAGLDCAIQGVPRATTVLAKISSFLAQAMSARLCFLPAAVSRR